jgi:hypothetical protein
LIRISSRQFYQFALAWAVVSWIVAIHFFSIGALLVSPLIWLAGNAVRSVLFPVRLD